ncbi:MAG: hypothetical protein L0338_32695 [Acidobacteria bacterium]|nr:hypothetical protein [Acidobacteriota bacterium]
MKNAHERFGSLEFTKRVKETTTRIRVYMDRLIAEPPREERGTAAGHFFSVFGSDAEVAALWAAVIEGAFFQARIPGRPPIAISLGPEAQSFRGSVTIQGRNRPIRHLVALSAELLKTRPGADREGKRTILYDEDPAFVLYRLSRRFGLPVVPEWSTWFRRELERRRAIEPLLGLGCSPVLVKGSKERFLGWIGKALKHRTIFMPEVNGPVSWNLPQVFPQKSTDTSKP